MRRLSRLLSGLMIAAAALGLLWAPAAAAVDFTGEACKDASVKNAAACSPSSRYQLTGNNGIIARATNLIAVISALAAVIMIIIGGLSLVTAAGDSGKVGSGRKMITFAVIGIIVVALARTIVVFVVSRL